MKLKKLLSFVAAAAMTVTALTSALSASVIGASAADEILPDSGSWQGTSNTNGSQLMLINNTTKVISALSGATEFYITFDVTGVDENTAAYIIFNISSGTSNWSVSESCPLTATPTDGKYTVKYSGTALKDSPGFTFLGVGFVNTASNNASKTITSVSLDSVTLTDPSTTSSNLASGQCGDDVYWSLSEDGILTISGTGNMYNWTALAHPDWYEYSSSIFSVVINEGVTSIGKYAFYYNKSMTEVSIPSTVNTIGESSFNSCSALTSVVIPQGVKELPDACFQNCKSLVDVTLPEGLESLGESVFNWCSFPKITLPSTLKTIGVTCFRVNSYLEEITIPDSVTTLGKQCFMNCSSLRVVNIGTGITSLPTYCFSTCASLEEINIKSTGIETITAVSAGNSASFDTSNNPVFNVVEGSITEETLMAAGYIKGAQNPEDPDNPDNPSTEISGDPLGYVYYGWTTTPFFSSETDESMANATQIKITFDCASDTSFNSYYTIPMEINIGGTVTSADVKGTATAINLGEKGCTVVIPLSAPAEAGQNYSLTGYTYGYPSAVDYVIAITKLEFLGEDGTVLATVSDKTLARDELNKTIAKAEAINADMCTTESYAELEKALTAAKALTDNAATTDIRDAKAAIETAVNALVYNPADYTAVDEAIDKIPTDLSGYTDESVKILNTAVEAVVRDLNITEQETVDGYAQAIEDAIAGLTEKPAPTEPDPTNPEPTVKPTTKIPTTAKATTKVTATTRNAKVVAADKTAAEKVMKQAKITKLTVKSKAKKKITVTWKKVKKAVGYEVQVSTNKKFKKSKIVLTKTTAKKKLTIKNKKIKSGKKYFVRVRAYATYKDANGKAIKVYSAWNKKLRKVTVK